VTVRPGTRFDEDAALDVWRGVLGRVGRPPSAARVAQARRQLSGRNALFLVAEDDARVVGLLLAELSTVQPGMLEVALLFGEQTDELLASLKARYPVVETPAAQADAP
jgi:hypothetical protein